MRTVRRRFGRFELDVAGLRLLRDGRLVKIQPQPLRILVAVTDRPGDVVTREELRALLWGDATFVEFDQGLGFCVRQIRLALGEEAARPVYIETIKGRGYRFIAPVIDEPGVATDLEKIGGSKDQMTSETRQVVSIRPRRAIWVLAASAVVLLGILVATVGTSSRVASPLSSQQVTFTPDLKEGPVVTDGTRVYFVSQGRPVEMSVNGGAAAPLRASVSAMVMLDISPDASEMLALKLDPNDETDRGSLWSVPVLGGSPRSLGTQSARTAHWSPDGRSIAYTDLNALFVSDRDGAHAKKIWDAPGDVYQPYFSPDSRRIRLTVSTGSRAGSNGLWELNVDGSSPHRLDMDWPDEADQEDGQWTPDGKRFIFVSGREGRRNVYEVVPPSWFAFWKKPSVVRLTAGQVDVRAFTPSRNGAGLWLVGQIAQGAMHAFDPAQNRFVPFLDGLAASVFCISPDRKWMVYVDYPRHHLWRSRLDGSDRLELTNFYANMPQWSRDSQKIAFSDWRQVYVVSVDGGVPEKMIENPNNDVFPSWSPDGNAIAFNDYPLPGRAKGIKVLDLTTRKITVMPGSEEFYMPSWSPDGRHLVAVGQNPSRMVLYSPQSGVWKDLKVFDAAWGNWVWAKDSQAVYIAMTERGQTFEPGFYRLAVVDGAWTRITSFDGLTGTPDGRDRFPSLTADGQPALMNDTSVVQIYSAKWNEGEGSRR
jgi:Tol biopolymer transport system component/DNA-binding winged helix-turn-helix (wHTH) protein